ncbi:flagellar protein FlaG [Cytobacillus gottheilii]|uniref:flagellar protein FlaG n=1 Tax=Cytobacillus gottheilii TaxID=859144 RepID=UPI0008331D38|nr:flagellar protein FlaG [Cytobacillus gottheilii]
MSINGVSNSVQSNNTNKYAVKSEMNSSPADFMESNELKPVQEFSSQLIGKSSEDNINKEEVEHIVKGMNEFLKPHYSSVSFKLHEGLEKYYVELIDKETKEVIREIPNKEILDMYAKMKEYLGLFIDEKL